MKHMRIKWRPMTQEPNIEPGTYIDLIVKMSSGGKMSMSVARDWEGNLHWNAFYGFQGTLYSTSEFDAKKIAGWLYFPK